MGRGPAENGTRRRKIEEKGLRDPSTTEISQKKKKETKRIALEGRGGSERQPIGATRA